MEHIKGIDNRADRRHPVFGGGRPARSGDPAARHEGHLRHRGPLDGADRPEHAKARLHDPGLGPEGVPVSVAGRPRGQQLDAVQHSVCHF